MSSFANRCLDSASNAAQRVSIRMLRRVCTENLDSNVMMMKSTKDRLRFNASGRLNPTGDRRIFIQCPVRPDLVVIAGISLQDPAQMRLAQDDDMVDALAPDRSDQSFGKAILPR